MLGVQCWPLASALSLAVIYNTYAYPRSPYHWRVPLPSVPARASTLKYFAAWSVGLSFREWQHVVNRRHTCTPQSGVEGDEAPLARVLHRYHTHQAMVMVLHRVQILGFSGSKGGQQCGSIRKHVCVQLEKNCFGYRKRADCEFRHMLGIQSGFGVVSVELRRGCAPVPCRALPTK